MCEYWHRLDSRVPHLNDGVRVDVGLHWRLFSDIGVTGPIELNGAAVPRVDCTGSEVSEEYTRVCVMVRSIYLLTPA